MQKQITREWREVELGEVAEIVSGSTPSTLKQEYWNGDINWITPAEIGNGDNGYYYETRKKITKQGLESASINLFPRGTVMLTSRAPIGKVAIAGVEMCSNQGFKNFICKNNKIIPEYLYYWLRSKKYYLNSIGRGATFKEVSKSIVSKLKISIPFRDGKPDLKEQDKIVKILKEAEKINKNSSNIEKLPEEYLKCVFYEMFGDPTRNEKGWEVDSLLNICYLKGRIGWRGLSQRDYRESGPLLLTGENLIDMKIDLLNVKHITEERYNESPEITLKNGDILLTKDGTIGKLALVENLIEKATIGGTLALIRPFDTKRLINYFILYQLSSDSIQKVYKDNTYGASIPHIFQRDLKKIKLIIPPLELQKEFIEIVEKTEKIKKSIEKSNKISQELLRSLINKAFRGEL